MTETMLHFADRFSGAYGYMILCVCACIENVVPPIPGDTVTLFGGYLTGVGRLNMFGVVMSTTAGSFFGFMMMFFLGRSLGRKFFLDRDVLFFSKKYFNRVANWFERYGYIVVLFNRFLSGARSVISLFAGITSMNTVRVAIYSFISCLVWNMFLVFAGCKVGENWGTVSEFIKKYNAAVMFVLAVLLVLFLIGRKQKKGANHLP